MKHLKNDAEDKSQNYVAPNKIKKKKKLSKKKMKIKTDNKVKVYHLDYLRLTDKHCFNETLDKNVLNSLSLEVDLPTDGRQAWL